MKKLILVFAMCLACVICVQAKSGAGHVVLVGLDGWGAYSMPRAEMPTVKALMDKGCYTMAKRSVLPSSSAVNWASMFMGACPELHGYTQWGSRTPELPSRELNENGIFPTIFSILREARPDAEIGCLYEWDGIKYVVDTLSVSFHAQAVGAEENSEPLCLMAEEYIKEKKPQLLAVVFDNPDHVGHVSGHDTDAYYAKLEQLDSYIARIVAATKDAGIADDTVFIITSDHGGIDRNHGGKTMREMETPFIIAGKNVRRAGLIDDSMMQFDVAANIAHIFGLRQPQVWIGRHNPRFFK